MGVYLEPGYKQIIALPKLLGLTHLRPIWLPERWNSERQRIETHLWSSPRKMSGEKVNTMKALGAEILRTPTEARPSDVYKWLFSLVMWIFDRQHGMPKTATSSCLPALPKTSATSSAYQLHHQLQRAATPNEAATSLISTRMLAIPWLTMMELRRRLLNNAKVAWLKKSLHNVLDGFAWSIREPILGTGLSCIIISIPSVAVVVLQLLSCCWLLLFSWGKLDYMIM